MLSVRLDPDLEWILVHEVDDLARFNILRYLHDRPGIKGDAQFFSDELGLRPPGRAEEALDALARCGMILRLPMEAGEVYPSYALTSSPEKLDLIDRLCGLSSTMWYGEIVERLAAKSLRRAKKSQASHKEQQTSAA